MGQLADVSGRDVWIVAMLLEIRREQQAVERSDAERAGPVGAVFRQDSRGTKEVYVLVVRYTHARIEHGAGDVVANTRSLRIRVRSQELGLRRDGAQGAC